jgi:ribosomal protein L7Ae-like RNA K-turn-binding protein
LEDISGLLHLARKAGRLAIGLTQVLDKANSGKEILILVTSDAGKVLIKRFTGIDVKMIEMTSDRLGEIFKRDKISVIGILDRNLAKEIFKRLDSSGENETKFSDA